RAGPEDQAEYGVPAFLAAIRDARGGSAVMVPLRWRVHPDTDCDSQRRRNGAGAGGPDDEPAPLRLVLGKRREIEPVGNRAEVRPESRSRGGVLNDFSGQTGNIDLFAVGPRNLPERAEIAKRSLHGPLVDLFDRFHPAGSRWLTGPGGRNT